MQLYTDILGINGYLAGKKLKQKEQYGKKNSQLKQSQFQAIVTLYNTIQYNTKQNLCNDKMLDI